MILMLETFIILIAVYISNSVETDFEVESKPKEKCDCVPFYQCSDESGNVITDGKGLLDLRVLENSQCNGYFDVCCNISKAAISHTTEAPYKLSGCGYQNSAFFPWYAVLYYREVNEPWTYKCGVSLIQSKAVLTAAHCVQEDGIWRVQIGNVIREVSKIIIHPEYNSDTMRNDIALVILKNPVQITEKINTICIPPPGTNFDNVNCKITSRVSKFNDKKSSFLKMLRVTVVPKQKCLDMLRSTRLGVFFQLHSSFLCAGTKNHKNTCTGDGGSPLVCPVSDQHERYHQIGIVSWGIGCGENYVPDVYIKVSAFRAWIDKEMINNNLDITSYRY